MTEHAQTLHRDKSDFVMIGRLACKYVNTAVSSVLYTAPVLLRSSVCLKYAEFNKNISYNFYTAASFSAANGQKSIH